jgi:protein-L-isoaspartate(D-aspartate) O-methyltransferase
VQDNAGKYWNNVYDQNKDFRLITSREITEFIQYVPTSPKVPKTCLDIGCGTGQLTRELYHRGYQVVGIDASASAIEIARSLTVVPSDKLHYIQLDIERDALDQLKGRPYSLITCKLVYAFIHDKPKFLKKVSQLLAPNGILVVATPIPTKLPPEKKYIAATEEDMDSLRQVFDQVASYEHEKQEVVYFIGRRRPPELG